MATLDSIYVSPASVTDPDLEYDQTSHRWLLSHSCVASAEPQLGAFEVDAKRKRISRHVYSQAQKRLIASFNWPFAEFVFDCTAQGLAAMKEALLSQLDADASSNYDGISAQSPADFAKGTMMDRKALAEAVLCQDAEDAIYNLRIDFTGRSLMVCMQIPMGILLPSDRYERWSY